MSATPVIHAVVRSTPDQHSEVPGRARVRAQSNAARDALAEAARRAGRERSAFPKDEGGAPLPADGLHWSVSHDATWVAGAVHTDRIGVDLERIALRRAHLREAVMDAYELALLGHVDALTFTRLWTAKEAVLKAAGVGLGELSLCRLTEYPGPDWLILAHRGERRIVRLLQHEEHVFAIHAPGTSWEVSWDLP